MSLVDEPHLVTAEEAAAILGVSLKEIKRKQAANQLRVVKRARRNKALYSHEEVMAMKMRRDDDRAALVGTTVSMSFTAEEAKQVCVELRAGASALDCLEKLVIHPAKIRAIIVEYEALSGGLWLNASIISAINELPLDGTFPVTKASDVLSLLASGGEGAPCAICTKNPRHMCKTCAIPFVRRQLQQEARAEKAKKPASDELPASEDD